MSYKLRFHRLALKEWRRLDSTLRVQFKKKLAERLADPRVPPAALSGMPDCYKIKLRSAGYRLIYRVEEDILYVTVLAVGKRERLEAYRSAPRRPPPSFRALFARGAISGAARTRGSSPRPWPECP